jgi:hypothetical protein
VPLIQIVTGPGLPNIEAVIALNFILTAIKNKKNKRPFTFI